MFSTTFKHKEICNFLEGNGAFDLVACRWRRRKHQMIQQRARKEVVTSHSVNETLINDLVPQHFCLSHISSVFLPTTSNHVFCFIVLTEWQKLHTVSLSVFFCKTTTSLCAVCWFVFECRTSSVLPLVVAGGKHSLQLASSSGTSGCFQPPASGGRR